MPTDEEPESDQSSLFSSSDTESESITNEDEAKGNTPSSNLRSTRVDLGENSTTATIVADNINFPLGCSDEQGWEWPSPFPTIEGLYYLPSVLDLDAQGAVLDSVVEGGLVDAQRDQAMVFPSFEGKLPPWTETLLDRLRIGLRTLPSSLYDQLFPPLHTIDQDHNTPRRQLILNAYAPGQGIKDHVDLLGRFGDGIIVCSFLAPIAMDLKPRRSQEGKTTVSTDACCPGISLFLRPGSVLILSRAARYEWTHGIAARSYDLVRSMRGSEYSVLNVPRRPRFSVTLRWMLEAGEVLR